MPSIMPIYRTQPETIKRVPIVQAAWGIRGLRPEPLANPNELLSRTRNLDVREQTIDACQGARSPVQQSALTKCHPQVARTFRTPGPPE